MRNSIIMITLALALSFLIPPVFAEKTTLIFASEEWKDATHSDGTGLYWDIFRAVYESEGYIVKPKIRSYEGSINLLKYREIDVMVGAYIDEVENVVYPKNHFAVDIVQAIYKNKSKYQLNGIESLKGRKIGWVKGYSYDEYLPADILKNTQIKRLNDRGAGFRLLGKNRIDYFLDAMGDLTDFFFFFSKYKKDYTREKLLELRLYVVFKNNDKGKKLAEIFDRRFSMLLKNGEIKKLYDNYKESNITYPSDF